MTNKPNYIEDNKDKNLEISKEKDYKTIDDLTLDDVIIASSGYTDSGERKATVELYWDLHRPSGDEEYRQLEITEAMLKIKPIEDFISLEFVFDINDFQINELKGFLDDYFSLNADQDSRIETRIIPKSMQGEVMLIARNPVLSSVSSTDMNNLNVIQLIYLKSDIDMGVIGNFDIEWKIETLPINYEKPIIKKD